MEKAIANVFGVPEDIIPEFLEKMDYSEIYDKINNSNYEAGDVNYFESFVSQIPSPKFKTKNGPMNANTININLEQKNKEGQTGSVYINRSQPNFLYKRIPPITSDRIKTTLFEPLINIVLQEDSVASPNICKLYNVYCEEKNGTYTFFYKMEKLGPTVEEIIESDAYTSLSEKEKLEIILKIYGPVYKTLKYLNESYEFGHSDLHGANLVFIKNPVKNNGKIDTTKLSVKIIDFGGVSTGLVYENYRFGIGEIFNEDLLLQLQPFLEIQEEEFGTKIQKIMNESNHNFDKLKNYIIEESEKLKGGRRKQKTRKQHKRKTV
jgi:hypothetical protein